MFEKQDLLAPFAVSHTQFEAFVHDLCDEYAFNPFHSFVHAVDVTAGAYIGVRQLGGASRLRPISQWALFLAAAGHDVGHPGTTNAHQKAVDTPLYREFGGDATLERMHAKLAEDAKRRGFQFLVINEDASSNLVRELFTSNKAKQSGKAPRAPTAFWQRKLRSADAAPPPALAANAFFDPRLI